MDATFLLTTTVLVALLGAALGSFLNVVVVRTHLGQSFLAGRSHCPHCNHPLHWYEMIPLLSYTVMGGRCRHCRTMITLQYLLMEALTAAAFIAVYLRFGWSWASLAGWGVVAGLLLIALYDARWSLIPDEFTITAGIAALLFGLVTAHDWIDMALGALLGGGFFLAQYVVSRKRWVGSGDIFLGVALGILLGWRMMALALLLSYLLGSIGAIPALIRRHGAMNQTIAFGPYLVAAAFVAWLWGPSLVQWYLTYAP